MRCKCRVYLIGAFLCVCCLMVLFLGDSIGNIGITGIDSNKGRWLSGLQQSKVYKSKLPLILLWGKRWGVEDAWPPEGYKFGKCVVTYDRSYIANAKAVVFHFTTLKNEDFPWIYYRKRNQIYIWWNAETPNAVMKELGALNTDMSAYDKDFFNWTMTYRHDADIIWGYGSRKELLNKVSLGKSAVDAIMKKKKKMAIWITSNCNYTSIAKVRMTYVQALMDYGLEVTRKGKCFGEIISKKELDRSIEEHKFYLAFENAYHCRDYITEKFWQNAFENDAVPIVMGPLKEDVIKVAPPDSFIHAEDYDTPADLLRYLNYLDNHEDEYRKYFHWREDETITDEKMVAQIQERNPGLEIQHSSKGLCEAIIENKSNKVINSLTKILFANDSEECLQIK